MYENAAYSEFDHTYVYALVRTVINNIYSDTSGTLVLGSVAVPTPPANVGKYSPTSVPRTPLGPCKLVRDRGNSSQ